MKLMYPGTKCSYLRLFINAGSSFETNVALGEYRIVYATGERWLGRRRAREAEVCPKPDQEGEKKPSKDKIFWPSDEHFRAERTFTFSERIERKDEMETHHYIGHEIELIEQPNGNLEKVSISEAEFGD